MPVSRLVLSRVLNVVFSRGLDLHVRDMSSGFRLYSAAVVKGHQVAGQDFEVLQALLVNALLQGYRVSEIPFTYQPRRHGGTHARVLQFGLAYLRAFRTLWVRRNSIASADYDARAYDALMPPQRYWQRQRYRHITQLMEGRGPCLDVGCGSSRIISALPAGSVALDILSRKLRYARRYGRPLVQGSALELPVASAAFPCVLCSQVIEHIPRGSVLSELDRVLQPGGRLILGTPDYANWQWRAIEAVYKLLLPQAYGDEHITHYTHQELLDEFVCSRGYALEAERYILQGELILSLRKPTQS
jgi:SAM-dependent methyltransferase